MRHLLICTLLLLSAPSPALAQHEPVLKSQESFVYPPIARAARVSGQVTVEFLISETGETTSVAATDGPAMLRGASENFVKGWKFDLAGADWKPETKYLTTITYKAVNGTVDPRTDPGMVIRSDSFHHFEAAILVGDTLLSKCPTGAEEDVPATESGDDFVEIERSACMGTCPDYSVKVQADGAVFWHGGSSVLVKGDRKATIGAAAARALLEEFRTKEFWSYCRDYSRNITDSSGTEIIVSLGGKTRTISDYAESSPDALKELLIEVDRVSDSHRWRHGDPAEEPITRVDSDAYLPKPGVTPLMIAANQGKTEQVKALIEGGANLAAADASGWTALMYAVAGYNGSADLLLKDGADPNQSSPHGDTALMVASLSGIWEDDLVQAGAKVNKQNKDGQTALMILALRGEPNEVRDALKAGANAALRDAKGRTAFDYLRLANCRKSPLSDPIQEWMTFGGSKCNALDAKDCRKSAKWLRGTATSKK